MPSTTCLTLKGNGLEKKIIQNFITENVQKMFIYTLVCNYMPIIRILAKAVLQISHSKGCSYTKCLSPKRRITQSINYGISSKVNQINYTLVCNYMPNIRILAYAVLKIFCSQGCSYTKCLCPKKGNNSTENLRNRFIIAKGPKYRFPVQIDFQKCREKIAGSLNEFCNRWCKRENVECDALKDWKLNIFKIIDRRISFYSQNTNMLPRKPKISYRYLKSGIEEFHRKYVLVPADKAANNVVVV